MAPAQSVSQNLPSLGGTERADLSPYMERKLGEQIMHDIKRNPDYLDDGPLLEYLNNFGATLVAARPEARGEANYDFFFFAVRDPVLNAFALPGGFIAVHSGLLLAARNESELASVVAHEIGHVAQRHIARMIGAQKQDALIPLASLVLAAIAARSSPDLASASMLGGQGLAMQRQLNFTREAEREADRVGLQIMQAGGFDPSGMVGFFRRLQNSTRLYGDGAPAYLQSHPLTTERIADIDARIRGQHFKKHVDSLDFALIRARVRVLQDSSGDGLHQAEQFFTDPATEASPAQRAAAKYGLAFIALKRGRVKDAETFYQQAVQAVEPIHEPSLALTELGISVRLAAGQAQQAIQEADAARKQFPLSRVIALQYGDALLAAGKNDEAVRYLRDQAQMYRHEPQLQDRLAKAYSAQGRVALQHMALAEEYAASGSLPAALDQLQIARQAPDATFYDQSVIDAREREFRARRLDEMQAEKDAR